jgi:hypothetical protein
VPLEALTLSSLMRGNAEGLAKAILEGLSTKAKVA